MRNESKSKGPRRCAVKERDWRRTFRRFEKSGSSVRAFCLENGIAEHQFYAWRREIARRDRERSADASNEVGRGSPKRRQAAKPGGATKKRSSVHNKETKPRPILTPLTIVDDEPRGATLATQSRPTDRYTDPGGSKSPEGADAIELITDDITIRVPPSAARESLVMILDVLEDRRC